jgi:L-ascorbate metabolism protein UlaG (beta-lactamase superfamily)
VRLFWITITGICIVTALVLLARQRLDAAFVVGTLGVVAWFLSYRVQMKRIIEANDIQQTRVEDSNEDVDY